MLSKEGLWRLCTLLPHPWGSLGAVHKASQGLTPDTALLAPAQFPILL